MSVKSQLFVSINEAFVGYCSENTICSKNMTNEKLKISKLLFNIEKCYREGNWTDTEKRKYLEGLISQGFYTVNKLNVNKIMEHFIKTRSRDQINSYTQKYFLRIQRKVMDKLKNKENDEEILQYVISEIQEDCIQFGLNTHFIDMLKAKRNHFELPFKVKMPLLFKEARVQEKRSLIEETNTLDYREVRNTQPYTLTRDELSEFNDNKSDTKITMFSKILNQNQYQNVSSGSSQASEDILSQEASLIWTKNILKTDFEGPNTTTFRKPTNTYSEMIQYFKKVDPKKRLIVAKQRKYKSYTDNKFKGTKLERINFLNDTAAKANLIEINNDSNSVIGNKTNLFDDKTSNNIIHEPNPAVIRGLEENNQVYENNNEYSFFIYDDDDFFMKESPKDNIFDDLFGN